MSASARTCWLEEADGQATLCLSGAWHLPRIAEIDADLAAARIPASALVLDGAALTRLDTAAALALLRRISGAGATIGHLANLGVSHLRVIEAVRGRLEDIAMEAPRTRHGVLALLGMHVFDFRALILGHLDFLGRSAAALGDAALRPRALRGKELAVQFKHVCIEAIPVVVRRKGAERTLALTAYGDLDVSIVDEKPPGRTVIRTELRSASERREVLALVKRAAVEHGQTVVLVTHDRGAAAYAERVVTLKDGRVASDLAVTTPSVATG